MENLIEQAKEHLRSYGYNGFADNIVIPTLMAEFASTYHKSKNESDTPEWLDDETLKLAIHAWNSHRITDDGLRVKAVKILIDRAKVKGHELRLSKALEMIKQHL